MWLPCGVLERIWGPRGKCRNMGCWCHQLYTISEALYKYVASAINVGYATYVWGMPVPRPDTQETAHCLQKIPGVHWREYQPLETNNSQNKISIKCVLNLAITRLCKATSEGFRTSQICWVVTSVPPLVLSPDLIWHIYRFQYNTLKVIHAGVGFGFGTKTIPPQSL